MSGPIEDNDTGGDTGDTRDTRDDSDDATLQLAPPAPLPRLAQYELRRQVGAGAMGVVHLAHDVDLDRPVAIKLLHDERPGGPDPRLMERFLREARSAAQLIHPHVALVYQVGRDGDRVFIVMEWLDGGDLSEAVKQRGRLPWQEAVAAARDAAAGLAAAHAAGLVHRDIKPSNLMRNRAGQVKLVDFGLARWHDSVSDLTMTGSILGTPAYLAPEQCRGEPATALSDQYSLACTLFHLLTGRPPFAAPHIAALLQGHLFEAMPDPRGWAPEVPESVCRIVQRAAAKRPEDRHASSGALGDALQAALDGRDSGQTRPAAAAATPGNLPLENTSFIGRERETAQAAELLQQARIVTLTGPGGTGKTRLSQHVARRLAPHFADGAWVVELARLTDAQAGAQDLAGAVSALFELREVAGTTLVDSLVEHLRERELLLLLDNCEHVLEAAAALATRLERDCRRVRVLATSRQPLGLVGELILGVPPLGTGEDGASAAELEQVEAVRLFVDRARAARDHFALGPDNADAVVQICRRLDGIPLAIELAAARVRVLAPAQIAARLDDAFKLLTGGQRGLLPRQQTLRALIDWSWQLLDAPERRLLAHTSVFAGDFSLEAAEAALADDEVDVAGVLDGLAGLVDKSLLVASERQGRMRYRLLQTIRQFAAEQLGALGTTAALQLRHARHFTTVFSEQVARLHGEHHAEAMATLELEHDNARAAFDWLTQQRRFDLALRLGKALADHWFVRGVLADGVARLERLLSLPPPDSVELALLLKQAGVLAMYLGRQDLALAWLEWGLTIARVAGRGVLEAGLLGGLGSLATARGELQVARQHYEASLALCRRLDDRHGQANAHNNLGIVLGELGEIAQARAHLEAALELHRATRSRNALANGLMSLAELEQLAEQPERAQALFESSLDIFASQGDDWSAAYARDGLGKCALDRGDLANARQHFEQALAVLRGLGDKGAIADQLDYLAQVARREGRQADAQGLAAESLVLRLALNNPRALSASFQTLAELHAGHQPERSARLFGAMQAQQARSGAARNAARRQREQDLQDELARRLGAAAFERLAAEGAATDPARMAGEG